MFHSDTYNTKICRYTSYNLSIIFWYFYTIHIPYKSSLCIVNVEILSRAIVYDRKRTILNKNDMRAFVHDRKRMILNKNDTRDVAFQEKKGEREKKETKKWRMLRIKRLSSEKRAFVAWRGWTERKFRDIRSAYAARSWPVSKTLWISGRE